MFFVTISSLNLSCPFLEYHHRPMYYLVDSASYFLNWLSYMRFVYEFYTLSPFCDRQCLYWFVDQIYRHFHSSVSLTLPYFSSGKMLSIQLPCEIPSSSESSCTVLMAGGLLSMFRWLMSFFCQV